MKSLLVCLLFATIVTSLDAKPFFDWTNCKNSSDQNPVLVTFHSILVTPYDLKKGGNVTITANFTLMESIAAGSIGTAEVQIGGFPFQNRTYDLCNTAMHRVGLKCPVAAGAYNVNMTAQIPIISPRGHYTATARAKDPNGKELVCLQVDFDIK